MTNSVPNSSKLRIKKIGDVSTEYKKLKSFLKEWDNNETYILQKTSGSTGKPKEIKIPKWKMIASAKMTGNYLHLEELQNAMLCMSIDYIGGKMMVIRAIVYDLALILTSVNSSPLKNIDFPVDFVAMVPLQVEKILQNSPKKLDFIKHLIIGGAPVSPKLIRSIQSCKGNIYSTFGMTETVSHIALKNLKKENSPYRSTGEASFSTQNNCLTISSEELKIKNLQTNDIVELIDTQSFHWLGRSDFVINSGGIKIHPEKVEEKIKSEWKLNNFIISSLPDDKLGEKVVFIGGKKLKNKETLKKDIASILSKYEIPKEYYFIEELKKTNSGKVDRIATRKTVVESF